jgi:uncharacterized protein (TIGR03905 family)
MDRHFVYKTNRKVCSREISFDIIDGIVRNVEFVGGCKGNTTGVAHLAEGMKAEDVVLRLKGINCHDGVSCPDELARAVEKCLKEIK